MQHVSCCISAYKMSSVNRIKRKKKKTSSAGSSSICPSSFNIPRCVLSQLPMDGGGRRYLSQGLTFTDKQNKVSLALGIQSCTYQSRPGLIYTAWDALWCVWWWWRRSRSTRRTGRSRSISSTCTAGLGSCPLNTRRS